MKKLILTLLTLGAISFTANTAFASTYVKGYTKKNGTHVNGYYRSDSNGIKKDNYSSYGNTNPYTGKAGTRKY